MRTNLRLLVISTFAVIGSSPVPSAGASLGDAPTAPTPEEVARLPRRGISKHGPTGPFTVNTANREESRNFFNTVYAASEGFSLGWDGDVASCARGTTTPSFKDLALTRINYFRAMAGVPAGISFNSGNNDKCQEAALMMSANNSLSHFPPPSWVCYTPEGADAADSSNLAIGNAGPDAITAYMEDFGGNNAAVGHRRWIFYPQTQIMGTGDIPETTSFNSANSTWVFDGHFSDPRPTTRSGFVSWPPAGYVPYQVVFARWSLSYPGANFGSATITMTSNGVSVATVKETVSTGSGENTVVWYPGGMNPNQSQSSPWPRPATDTLFQINVQNVTGSGVPTSFSYTVTVMDPQVPGPDTVVPTVAGPDQPAVNQANNYTFTAVPGATGYQWRRAQRAAFTAVEGAENGLTDFTANTSPDYNAVVNSPTASGSAAFHLAHPTPPTDQFLTYNRVLLPGSGAQMQFRSRLGWATPTQVARVQVSLDQGSSWQDVYAQAGSNEQGETSFSIRTASLASFVGRSVLVRFNYDHTGGQYFPQTSSGVGWYIDDISFTDTEELTSAVVTDIASGTSFAFTPAQPGDYALDVRAEVYDAFHLEWGPIKRVTASASATPVLTIIGAPALSGGQVQIDFDVANYQTGMSFQLLKATDVTSGLTPDSSASFQTIIANSRFRFTTSTDGAPLTFYRVRTN
ncbi:MAG TPA: CAP domain-containing protein [Verrucomicrobiae bacterium]|nr:CAP domain-containing protein [Verrucomicrobiae bacterium]